MKKLKVERYIHPDHFGHKYRFLYEHDDVADVQVDIDELIISGCKTIDESIINKRCKITPFEGLDGVIIAIFITKKGVEYQVRYYIDGEQKTEYFFDWEIEII